MYNDQVIKKFALYGFLKNLRFFEPFFLLFLREKGLSFTEIGFLYSFREIAINLMEIPSGAVADLFGRKSAMLLSLFSYMISFLLFGFSHHLGILFTAMFVFSIGEAFRTGTHKAMIFDYLKYCDVLDQKKKVYGYTRSWSQIGSALSVLIATMIVLFSKDYTTIFWASCIPYLICIVNIATYPSFLNRKHHGKKSLSTIFLHTIDSFKNCWRSGIIRTLLIQSLVFQGSFKSIKDYIQPLIASLAVILPFSLSVSEQQKTAVMVGAIYFVLYYLSSYVSKKAHSFSSLFRSDFTASSILLLGCSFIGLIFGGLGYLINPTFAILAFIAISVLTNIWRPIVVSLFGDFTPEAQQATVLSIESQSKTLGAALFAPVMGMMADWLGAQSSLLFFALVMFITLGLFSRVQSTNYQ